MKDLGQSLGRTHPARRDRAGFTLIEVAWSCLLLAVLGIASSSFATFAQRMTELMATKRAALEAANSRLEDVRGTRYADISPVVLSFQTNYLTRSGGTWTRSLSDPRETVLINARTCPMVTSVSYVDLDGGVASYDGVRVHVRIQHSPGTGGSVVLETLVTP